MSVYTVKNVLDRKEWSGNYGPMVTYVMDVEDENGSFSPKVELNRKPESREPQTGERFVGHLEETNFAEKLKIDFEATKDLSKGSYEASTGSSGGSQNVSKGQSKGDVDWDARNAEIRRQHSQQVALEALAQIDEHAMHPAALKDLLREWADWFDQDAIDAGQKASQGAASTSGSPHSSPPQGAAPGSPPADDEHAWLENLLIQGGASTHAAGILAQFATEELSPENLKKCEGLLSDLDTQSEGRRRLESSYEKAKGPVPAAPDHEDDIPFHHPEYREFGSERMRWRF